MAIAIERPRISARRRTRYRVQHAVAKVLTYLGLVVALVFFLGPFF